MNKIKQWVGLRSKRLMDMATAMGMLCLLPQTVTTIPDTTRQIFHTNSSLLHGLVQVLEDSRCTSKRTDKHNLLVRVVL